MLVQAVAVDDISHPNTSNPTLESKVYRKRNVTATLVQRAEKNGYKAIVLTGDSPKIGRREADMKNKTVVPAIKNVEGL
ncbi:hypothetical protein V6N13_149207 [Hibiscus sabdariffa]|uniref:FMN-dependent dehydrogenase domain-containing protein n=1 Tax=Hibiscus sabdariffa TaxID=183260 RepID=A0ABR2EI12_9ROSI